MIKKETFEILYIDKVTNEFITTLGSDCKVRSVEYSWYDIKKKVKIYINKIYFISRVEVKHGR